jgi:tetratricopeptide (TPR) repeat protein
VILNKQPFNKIRFAARSQRICATGVLGTIRRFAARLQTWRELITAQHSAQAAVPGGVGSRAGDRAVSQHCAVMLVSRKVSLRLPGAAIKEKFMEIKSQLVEMLESLRQEVHSFAAQLTDVERAAGGTPQRWSAKDNLAHIAEAVTRTAQQIAAFRRNEPSPVEVDTDFEAANQKTFERNKSRAWADVLGEFDRAYGELIEHTAALTEQDLAAPFQFYWQQQSQLMWHGLVGAGYSHPLGHLTQLYIERGESALALSIEEKGVQRLLSLDGTPRWQGVAIYNLACHYALAGEKAQAIAKLGEALRVYPGLTDWSKQDADLASLRGEPAYQALYAQPPA